MEIAEAIRTTRTKIVETLNDSRLPIDVMVMLLEQIHSSIARQADEMYMEAQKQKEGKTDVSGN